jgi:hypothetical protein
VAALTLPAVGSAARLFIMAAMIVELPTFG